MVWQGSAGNCRPYADQTRLYRAIEPTSSAIRSYLAPARPNRSVVVHEIWGFDQVRIVIEAEPVNLLKRWAGSTGRCNTRLKFTCRSLKAQSFSRALIEAQSYLVEIGLRVTGQVGFLGEVLS